MTALAARHRPRAARRRAVRDVARATCRRCSPPTSASTLHPRARAVVFPALGAYVGGDIVAGHARHRAWTATSGPGCSSTSAPTARSSSATATRIVSTAAPAGPAFEGGAIRCGMRAADGAIEVVKLDRRTACDAAGHRRRRAAGPVRLRPRRRGRRAGPGRPARRQRAASSPTRRPSEIAPALADRLDRRSARSGSSCCTGREPDATPRSRSTSPSATSASCSSPRRAIATGWTLLLEELGLEQSRRPAGAARRLVRQLPVPGLRRPDRPGAEAPGAADRLRRQRRRRGREDGAAQRCASAPAPWPCWRR